MKIAISGPQCTGKTTLIKALAEDDMFEDYEVYPSPTSYLAKVYGLDWHTANTEIQLATLALQLANTYSEENGILDRSVIDNLAYYEYYKEKGLSDVRESIEQFLYKETELAIDYIDFHFLLPIEIPLIGNGSREVDEDQQKMIMDLIRKLFRKFDITPIILHGSVSDRVKQVKSFMRKAASIRSAVK